MRRNFRGMKLTDHVTSIKGVGAKAAALLAKMQIETVGDLLMNLPMRYADLSMPKSIIEMEESDTGAVKARVVKPPRWIKRAGKMSIFSFEVSDMTEVMSITIFNMPYSFTKFKVGEEYVFEGRVRVFRNQVQMQNPNIYQPGDNGIIPYYHLTAGISQASMRKFIGNALDEVEWDVDDLSHGFMKKYGILPKEQEFFAIHRPADMADAEAAKRSIILRELLLYAKITDLLSSGGVAEKIPGGKSLVSEFIGKLPFTPTGAQQRAMEEIAADIAKTEPMNRLLQGDVGSGKTVVALFAMYAAAKAGKLSILMAPTQILCEQHYENAKKLLPEMGVYMLSGLSTKKERDLLREKLISGEVRILIGTHALLYGIMDGLKAAVIITDEQHRFGVAQRAALAGGGMDGVHTLIMSATPIPRTLALILYNKATVSILDELPKGRQKIKTHIVSQAKRADMYRFIKEHIAMGEQAYAVCPLIEDNPDINAKSAVSLMEDVVSLIPETELLHGLTPNKAEIMQRFKNGETKMLVSTTVVEVGVDVPNATIMVIENAERFGLAQLHQLRGRVGRGNKESFCFLVSGGKAAERLKIIRDSTDGFYIAEKDLEMRGSGDLIGQRQSGKDALCAADLIRDAELLQLATKMLEDGEFASDAAFIEKDAREKISSGEFGVVLN
ncbi:MAG: ATP-dependent DNA helicase RecG [Christensenellaceae bacterium]|nr:ATP-dependent DNA helicase RecG [Christensenellaceae bacterium]